MLSPRRIEAQKRARKIALTGLTLAVLGAAAPGLAESPAAAPAQADGACAESAASEMAQRVQDRYDGIRDLAAEFEQQSQSASFAGAPLMDADVKKGHVIFSKPGKMKWVYAAPDESVVVSDGSALWIHDVEGESATRLEVTQGYLSGAAVQFLLGDGKILEEFSVAAVACEGEQITLDLLPKQDATYERLGLVADRETAEIRETSLTDLFGNRTVIRFLDMQTNQSPAAETFVFTPPEGVEVIDYSGG